MIIIWDILEIQYRKNNPDADGVISHEEAVEQMEADRKANLEFQERIRKNMEES